MDSLALLCNLYGDGPQTLRRLREAGCGTLASLESIESERLASLLRTSVRAARRFQSEGRLLRERSEPPGERSSRVPSSNESTVQQTPTAYPLLNPVLIAWREHDARVGTDERAPGDAPTVTESKQPKHPTRLQGPSLEDLEGMDADLIACLRSAGVDSLHELCNTDVLDLAGRGVAGYTRLLRMQFLARRRLDAEVARNTATVEVSPRPMAASGLTHAAATFSSAAGTRGPGADALAEPDEPRCTEPKAAPQAGASARLEMPGVVIPHPPPERRRADRSQVGARGGGVARFSPRVDSCVPAEPTLQSELERYAQERESVPQASPTARGREEEGSSGPFA
jgi:hypothetical protein